MRNKEIDICYFTFNETVNSVYLSQVIEVILQFKQEGRKASLIAILSPRKFMENRKRILNFIPDAKIYPSLGRIKNWKRNTFWLNVNKRRLKTYALICRGPLSTNIAISSNIKSKIIYDGRGAVYAEQQEYGVYNGSGIEHELFNIEKNAVLKSHAQIAISKQLVNYWKETSNYNSNNFKIIPCTISNKKNLNTPLIPDSIENFLNKNQNKIITVFSGGNGKWQQINRVCDFLETLILKQDISCIFLSPKDENISQLKSKFPDSIFQTTVSPELVYPILKRCDFGIVLRENNITNKVASPVKIAEYLYAGLKIIISPNVGDYSNLIKTNNLGIIVKGKENVILEKVDTEEKKRIASYAQLNLTKSTKHYNFQFD